MVDRHRRLLARIEALGPAPALALICQTTVDTVGVTGAAVVLMTAQESGSIAGAYGIGVTTVEDLQFSLGEGPCLETYATGLPMFEPDVVHGTGRWPAFAMAAAEAGVLAVFTVPLRIGAIRLGVFYLVRDRRGPLTVEQLEDAYDLAWLATLVLLEREHGEPGALDGAVGTRWDHRAVVHQATGMVSVQLDVELGDALARIRARAFALDRSIYDVAVDVVARRLRFGDE